MTEPKKGLLLVLEGIDLVGKSTAKQYIKDFLQQRDIVVHLTREPGGTDIAEDIRDCLIKNKGGDEPLLPMTELLLVEAARNQHVHNVIQPCLDAGTWVVSDRFNDSTFAYQGGNGNIDPKSIEVIEAMTIAPCEPDYVFLLDAEPEELLPRLERGELNAFDTASLDHKRVTRKSFLDRAKRTNTKTRYIIIDALLEPKYIKVLLNAYLRRIIMNDKLPQTYMLEHLLTDFIQPIFNGDDVNEMELMQKLMRKLIDKQLYHPSSIPMKEVSQGVNGFKIISNIPAYRADINSEEFIKQVEGIKELPPGVSTITPEQIEFYRKQKQIQDNAVFGAHGTYDDVAFRHLPLMLRLYKVCLNTRFDVTTSLNPLTTLHLAYINNPDIKWGACVSEWVNIAENNIYAAQRIQKEFHVYFKAPLDDNLELNNETFTRLVNAFASLSKAGTAVTFGKDALPDIEFIEDIHGSIIKYFEKYITPIVPDGPDLDFVKHISELGHISPELREQTDKLMGGPDHRKAQDALTASLTESFNKLLKETKYQEAIEAAIRNGINERSEHLEESDIENLKLVRIHLDGEYFEYKPKTNSDISAVKFDIITDLLKFTKTRADVDNLCHAVETAVNDAYGVCAQQSPYYIAKLVKSTPGNSELQDLLNIKFTFIGEHESVISNDIRLARSQVRNLLIDIANKNEIVITPSWKKNIEDNVDTILKEVFGDNALDEAIDETIEAVDQLDNISEVIEDHSDYIFTVNNNYDDTIINRFKRWLKSRL